MLLHNNNKFNDIVQVVWFRWRMIGRHLKKRKWYNKTKYARQEAQKKSNWLFFWNNIGTCNLVHNRDESEMGEAFHICRWRRWWCVWGGDVAAAFAPGELRADSCKRWLQRKACPCLWMNLAVFGHALVPKMQAQHPGPWFTNRSRRPDATIKRFCPRLHNRVRETNPS